MEHYYVNIPVVFSPHERAPGTFTRGSMCSFVASTTLLFASNAVLVRLSCSRLQSSFGGGAGFSCTIQPGARTFEDKKMRQLEEDAEPPPRAAEQSSLLSYESSLAGSQKKYKQKGRRYVLMPDG